jgi:hypothetical protein
MARHSSHILELARKGAEARIKELEAEIGELRKVFLHLPFGSAASPAIPARAREIAGPASRRRRRRGMSPAARKAVSLRMKKYWAARRAGRKK